MSKLRPGVDEQQIFIAARRVLLDAAEALAEQSEALILVGAQAVYLHSGDADIPVAIFTADADIGIDRDRLSADPHIEDVMRGAGFDLGPVASRRQPGTWLRSIVVDNVSITIPVDLLIPSQYSDPGPPSRGGRIPPHDRMATRKILGIELALEDNDLMLIESLEQADGRSVRMRVAGPVALLVAKAYKIRDRATDTGPDRQSFKDAADVIRLMRTTDTSKTSATFTRLLDHEDPRIADTAQEGLSLLSSQFGRARGVGISWAQRALEGALPASTIEALATAFMREVSSAGS